MSDKKRISSKWLSASLYGHFNLWAHSLRTILMAIFILLMNYMLTRSYESGVTMRQWEVHLGETLFAYLDSGFNLTVTSIALLVMMSELPKRVSYQNYTLMRLSRRRWLVSLIIFCTGMVLIFIMLMIVLSTLFSLTFVTPGDGWSDLERLAKDPKYVDEYQYVAAYIRILTPFTACVLAAVILFFFWLTMAFLILLFSLCGIPNFGVVFCVSLLLLHITLLFESLPRMKLPVQFATLSAVASQVQEHKFRFIALVIAGYIVGDALLIKLMDVRIQHMDIQFSGKE